MLYTLSVETAPYHAVCPVTSVVETRAACCGTLCTLRYWLRGLLYSLHHLLLGPALPSVTVEMTPLPAVRLTTSVVGACDTCRHAPPLVVIWCVTVTCVVYYRLRVIRHMVEVDLGM